jgi:HAT1-interacting factor 1
MADSTPALGATSPSLQKKLDHLKASATQQYSLKNYSAAAELYSEAAEVQDLINGEMSPDNADLLYQYGRCLYHVGVSKSDVLGGKVAGNGNEEPKRKKRKTAENGADDAAKGKGIIAGALKSGEVKGEEEADVDVDAKPTSDKPFFQITGDENWTDSEGEDEDAEDDAEEGENDEEEDDDFAIAYEILDVARVLLARKLASLEPPIQDQDQTNTTNPSPEIRPLRERLADTHDLQAEIKLENEQFADAVLDARAALALKLQLYPLESGLIAEAHYKLAIALDFAALPAPPAEDSSTEKETEDPKVDESLRALAAVEMEAAIASCNARIAKEGADAAVVGDIKAMVAEMRNRLAELRKPVEVADVSLAAGGPGGEAMGGILSAMLGASKSEQAKVLERATSQANDLSGLVKKRKARVVQEDGNGSEGEGKKKARVETVEEEK